jgi:2-polyprenyl-3-methyl-5-hydroxy-6-metoxy-1,4-benzoquinol methylase
VTTAVKTRDWSLGSGERQTSPFFGDVNAAHRERYAWAASMIGERPGLTAADVFCATGYGTRYLADQTHTTLWGIDGSDEAIARAAAAHGDGATFAVRQFPCALPEHAFDFVVSIESIEHVEDDAAFVRALVGMLVPGGALLLSVPNEERIPCAEFKNPFHVRHYTPAALRALVAAAGLTVVTEYSQHIHRFVRTAWGVQRQGRIPDAEQCVREDPGWASNPCALLAHCRRV